MTKKEKNVFIVSSLLCLLPIAIGLLLYNKLPESMAIHWNIQGEADNYMNKLMAILFIPILMFIVDIIAKGVTLLEPKKPLEKSTALKYMLMFFIPVFTFVIQSTIYLIGLGYNLNINSVVSIMFGITFIVLGNYMPKVTANKVIGVRLPWTLSNDEVWYKTHRLTSIIFVITGICLLLIVLFFSNTINIMILTLATIFIAILIPIIYSKVIFNKMK